MSNWLDGSLSFPLCCMEMAGVRGYLAQKLEAKELAEQARREKAASVQGISVWNQARP